MCLIGIGCNAASEWVRTLKSESPPVSALVGHLLPFVLKTVDALYVTTMGLPEPLHVGGILGMRIGVQSCVIRIPASAEVYARLRCALSLVGDVYNGVKVLLAEDVETRELRGPLDALFQEADRFRNVRNFFAHLDERLARPDKHGVSGPMPTNCGIEYAQGAAGCFHMVLQDDVLHFTNRQCAEEIHVGKNAYRGVFDHARDVYRTIWGRYDGKGTRNCPDPSSIYPAPSIGEN